MAKVSLNDLYEDSETKFKNKFFHDEEIEVDEGYEEWEKEILNSENPQKELLQFLKTKLGPEDRECIDMILEILESGECLDIVGLEAKLKEKYEDITPLAIFQYMMLLSGIGLVQLEE